MSLVSVFIFYMYLNIQWCCDAFPWNAAVKIFNFILKLSPAYLEIGCCSGCLPEGWNLVRMHYMVYLNSRQIWQPTVGVLLLYSSIMFSGKPTGCNVYRYVLTIFPKSRQGRLCNAFLTGGYSLNKMVEFSFCILYK